MKTGMASACAKWNGPPCTASAAATTRLPVAWAVKTWPRVKKPVRSTIPAMTLSRGGKRHSKRESSTAPSTCCALLSYSRLGGGSIGRIGEHSHASCGGHKLTKEFQPLRYQLTSDPIDPCDVTARLGEAGDKTKSDWVFGDAEDNWNRRGCRLGRERRGAECGDHGNLAANQCGRQLRQPIHLILGPPLFDCYVLVLDKAGLLQALAKAA